MTLAVAVFAHATIVTDKQADGRLFHNNKPMQKFLHNNKTFEKKMSCENQ